MDLRTDAPLVGRAPELERVDAVLVLGSAAAVGFGGSQLATRLAMRARPADAMGARE
jgi:hypothetical protein